MNWICNMWCRYEYEYGREYRPGSRRAYPETALDREGIVVVLPDVIRRDEFNSCDPPPLKRGGGTTQLISNIHNSGRFNRSRNFLIILQWIR
jgi:hypothetical protein